MTGRILLIYLSLFAFWGPVSSRAVQQPAQSTRISGAVLDAVTRDPLKDARVILESRRDAQFRVEVTTDDKGLFLLDQLQPGSYLLHAERSGYITDHLPAGYGRPVPLSMDIQAGRNYPATLTLVRTASVSGRVYDINRQPVAKAEIQIMLPQYSGFGRRILTRLVIASPAYGAQPAAATAVAVRANNAAPTYYPGVTNPDEAVSIKLDAGTDFHAIDFTLAPISSLKVSGRILNPLLQTGRGVYDFYLIPRNLKLMEAAQPVPNHSDKEGQFELTEVRPGSYDLYVGFRSDAERPVQFRFYTGRLSFDVTDHNLTDLTVVIDSGVDIPGQVVLDESAHAANPNIRNLYPLFMVLDGMPGILGPTATLGRSSFVQEDGTFVIPNSAPGRYYLTMVLGGAPGLYLASARLGTENILGRPFEITDRTTDPLILEVSGSGGKIQGAVIDQQDVPVAGAQVELVPPIDFREDQTAYKSAIADNRGRFKIVGVRPGHYTAYCVRQRVDQRAWMNPEFLTPYLAFGEQIEVLPRQNIERNLRVIAPK